MKYPTCEVKALDNNGVSYSALCHFNLRFTQNIEEFKIYKFKSDKVRQADRVLFRGTYKIPSNSYYTTIATYKPYKESVEFGLGNRIESINNSFKERACDKKEIWEIKLSENIDLILCQFENYLELLILTQEKLTDETLEKIQHTLDFILGNESQLAYYSIKDIGTCYYSFNSMYSTSVSMQPPLLMSVEPSLKEEYSELFKSYFQFIQKIDNKDYKN